MYGHKYVFGKYNIGYQGNYESAPYILYILLSYKKCKNTEEWEVAR